MIKIINVDEVITRILYYRGRIEPTLHLGSASYRATEVNLLSVLGTNFQDNYTDKYINALQCIIISKRYNEHIK